MTCPEFIDEYNLQTDVKSSIICLENTVNLKEIPSKSCRLTMLHFIVIQGKVHDLPDIHISDLETGEVYILSKTLSVFVE